VLRRAFVENSWLPRKLKRTEVDLVHHLGGIVPRSPVPAVVTLHDLQYLSYPEYFSVVKRRYLGAMQGTSLRRARVVTAISEFTRAQAIEHFDLDPNQVVVVPPIVREVVVPAASQRAAVRREFGLTRDFLLYPAAMYPHKNHETLVRAFAAVAAEHDVDLVLTGATGAGAWGSALSTEVSLRALASQLGVDERVHMLGYVSSEQLAALYGEATMMAFPSRFEGFGLPVVEAMSAGCAVIAAAATALPALVADGGVLVDPDDVEAWAREMSLLFSDGDSRRALSGAGAARARELAALDPIEPLVNAYRRAVA
jgi:alpha-1,3-rhamnosyl/mannosyltransferase